MQVRTERIEYIDGLRAIAVLSVLATHIAINSPNVGGPLYHSALEGHHGVDLFFVLSGFCLAYPTLQKWRTGAQTAFRLADFGAKRIVRIVPPFYIASLVLIAVAVALHVAGRGSSIELPPPVQILESLLFLDGHVQLLNGSFWTLMVEFRWYFLFPVLLAVWLKSPRGFCAIGIASIVLYTFTRARGLDFGTLPGFMLGIVAADIHARARLHDGVATILTRLALPMVFVCAAAGIAVEANAWIPGFDGADVAFAYQPTIVGWQLATFFLVVAAGSLSWLRAILATPALVATGVASYAIYLVHEPIVEFFVHRMPGFPGVCAAAVLALGAGFLFWAVAERPFTTGKLRRPLLGPTGAFVRRCFALSGVPETILLAGKRLETLTEPDAAAVPLGGLVTVEPGVPV
jgi:peptidoglycan/LPS O-acetylase OafA/YrhL